MGIKPNVVPDVVISLAQSIHPTQEHDKETKPIQFSEHPQEGRFEEDNEGHVSVEGEKTHKEENTIMNKYHNTDVYFYDLDTDDEPVVRKLTLGIAKRLKSREGKVVESSSNLQ